MKGEISTKIRMNNGIMLITVAVSRIYSFHTHVETQNEIVEV